MLLKRVIRETAVGDLEAKSIGLCRTGSIAALQALAALCISRHHTQIWVACLQTSLQLQQHTGETCTSELLAACLNTWMWVLHVVSQYMTR